MWQAFLRHFPSRFAWSRAGEFSSLRQEFPERNSTEANEPLPAAWVVDCRVLGRLRKAVEKFEQEAVVFSLISLVHKYLSVDLILLSFLMFTITLTFPWFNAMIVSPVIYLRGNYNKMNCTWIGTKERSFFRSLCKSRESGRKDWKQLIVSVEDLWNLLSEHTYLFRMCNCTERLDPLECMPAEQMFMGLMRYVWLYSIRQLWN